tara:strand:- start:228 stop:419 length:192 start_codon:yes stop_codon:yes gene_type:complete
MENGYLSFTLNYREQTREEIDEMEFYIRTGCVHKSYLEKVLGDQGIGVSIFPRRVFSKTEVAA